MKTSSKNTGLARRLNWIHGATTMAGMMIGAGIFVVTGTAASSIGPMVPLGFLIVTPLIAITAVIYSIYMSGPLGEQAGGAYVHISRTWNSLFIGYIVMWVKWIAYAGTIAAVGLELGGVLHSFRGLDFVSQSTWALITITALFVISLLGVNIYANVQAWATIVLVGALLLLVVPGFFFVNTGNYTPMFPKELYSGGYIEPLLSGIAILLFSYIGFEALAQAGEETKSPNKTLPKLFITTSVGVSLLYTLVTFVVIGVLGWQAAADAESPLTSAARAYFPGGTAIILPLATILAFVTTMNTSYLVPSRLLYAFGKDKIVPTGLAHVNKRFKTPDISLLITYAVSVLLLLTATFDFAINIAVAAVTLVYFTHSLAGMTLPWLKPKLYAQSKFQPPRWLCTAIGLVGAIVMGGFGWQTLSVDGIAPALKTLASGDIIAGITANPAVMLVLWGGRWCFGLLGPPAGA